MGFYIPLILIIIICVVILAVYNGIVTKRNRVDNCLGQIDVQLKRRFDLIPNLVEVVKGAAGHESETLTALAKARSMYLDAKSVEDGLAANAAVGAALGRLMMVAESYPNLKANESFVNLQHELVKVEEKIGFARQFYNDTVMKYNDSIQKMPGALIANLFRFQPKTYFKADATEKENPTVKF